MARKTVFLLLSTIFLGFSVLAATNSSAIQPTGLTLGPSQAQQFTLNGYTQDVTWSVQPVGLGTITPTGLYTAPSALGFGTVVLIYAQPIGSTAVFVDQVYLSPTFAGSASNSNGGSGSGPTPPLPPSSPSPSPTPAPNQPSFPTGGTSGGTSGGSTQNSGAISVSISPASTYLLAGKSVQFTALVQGTGNPQVQWFVSHGPGTIVNGLYVAPSSVSSDSLVTISATSVVDPSKTGTATVLLGPAIAPAVPTPSSSPVGISIGPGSMTLAAGQSVQFTAHVAGTTDTTVLWSLTPNVGTVVNGLYTAPANVTSKQALALTVTSAADPTKSAAVSLVLKPNGNSTATSTPVAISLSPTSASLIGRQSATFTPTVTGTSNTAVTWSISPQLGTIANGVYKAPTTIESAQSVTVTAISAADPTKSATANVSLKPIGVTVTPTSVSLTAGKSATFTPTVTGTSTTSVSWSLSPSVGTLVNGIYTAPATISGTQTVTLKVASTVDSTKSATATITLTPIAVVGLSIAPATATVTGGKSTTFTPTVTGTSNTAVTWSISPQVGTITNGVYKAPAVVASQQNITVTAKSAADSTKTDTSIVTLKPIGVTVAPTSVSLAAGKSATFTPTVTGTSTTTVSWSLNPPVGTVVNGVYTAPATISNAQTIALKVASTVDSTKSATATISLTPTVVVGLTLAPTSASLTGGQSASFTPTVTGSSNTTVTWSISPQVGSITNGVYQAPAIIASQQNITVTAKSSADSTKTATATVSLKPIGVTVAPTSVSLAAGKSASFVPTVTGTSTTSVSWSLSPSVGTLVNGVYTAPATISNAQTVTLKVASTVDSIKSATATISLTPPPPSPTSSSSDSTGTAVTLPVEVIGPNGTTATASVTVPSGANLSGQLSLWMEIHGLRYETQASVQVNNSAWLPISTPTVTLLGNAAAYGGIGGGFSTLKMTKILPAGAIQSGTNTIRFRFNQTDGRVSGFRVLAFNIQAADGSSLLPASAFVYEDPDTWQPPSTSASDISTGQTLWHTASLTAPTGSGSKTILAHCSDCHAQDGRDLKYFNYSNNSIRQRSVFHGLSAQQGDQIASYIRTLNVANPGRPWNPPYQPGPGLDSKPVIEWAAGAGLDAVLDSDQEMIAAMFPSGFLDSVFSANSRLNQRELPLPVQLPDWNQWLPGTHPMDAFGSTFTSNGYNTIYQTLRANLGVLDPAAYVGQKSNFDKWFDAYYGLYVKEGTPVWNKPSLWTPTMVDAMYSLPQWGMVKNWELNNEFQLEGFSQNIFGAQGNVRAWYSQQPFFVAPHELQMPSAGVAGLRNGSRADYVYLSYIWYNLQLILNDSNGHQQDHHPIDWGYSEGFVKDLGSLQSPQSGIQMMWLIKGLQVLQEAGTGPQLGIEGWQPSVSPISLLVTPEWDDYVWTSVDASTRATLAGGFVKQWLAQASRFTPQQFYTGGWTTATAVPVKGGSAYDNVFPDWIWYTIPRLRFLGVDPTLVNQLVQWAQTMWPKANWSPTLSSTCSWQTPNNVIHCSQ